MKRIVKSLLRRFGYELRRIPPEGRGSQVVLYRCLDADGAIDRERYGRIQEAGNRRKLDSTWVIEENVAFLADYIRARLGTPRFGLCHGTRRGLEQRWFRKYLGCEVLGTEISSTADAFPHTIQWDFHDVKPQWLDSVDFIYSNSIDHSYAPEACLNAWMSCLREGGLCILEHSSSHEALGASELDPFGADLEIMPYLIATWGRGEYGVRELLPAPRRPEPVTHMEFIVVQRFATGSVAPSPRREAI